jgi:glycoside/pentoside/hexuronide:cation symporter, GPH family
VTAARLPVWLKISHGFGSVAYGVKDNGFSVFLLIFYNQVLGIDAGLVGAAIMFALIFDAFIDPVIGELSDRTQSRWGRRLPWLYLAPIPLGLSWLALWHPPQGDTTMTIAWLFVTAVIVRTLVSACEVPSIALVPELTSDYDERTRLMRYRYLFGWAGGLLVLILAYGVFFAVEGGVSNPAGYDAYALCGALLMTFAVLFSAAAQHKWVAKQSPQRPPNQGLSHALGEVKETLSNKAFLWLIGAALFGLINQGVSFALSNYVLAYLWQLTQLEMLAYAVTLFVTVGIAFIIVAPLAERIGKKYTAMGCAALSLLFNTLMYLGWLLDLVPGGPDDPDSLYMFAFVTLSNSFAIAMMMATSSMLADVVEASQHETGRRSEGLFFAGYFFMQKCAIGIGTFIAGMILTFAQFPANAVPGQLDVAILDRLALGFMVSLFVIGVTGIAVLRHFPITRADHDERVRLLALATEKKH